MKLKVLKEWNREDTEPGEPDCEVDTMYGINDWPSKRAEDAFPNEESESVPDTMRTRSDSMMPLPSCVFCRGTIVNCETSVVPSSVEPSKRSMRDQVEELHFKLTDRGP